LAPYSDRPCYAGIGEFSVYVAREQRGGGTGRVLVEALAQACREKGFWKLVSRVFPENQASRALCRATGFREVGVHHRHARLDGEWRDVVVVERLLDPIS
jgi:L-amino acid N-acyltransferase YncA